MEGFGSLCGRIGEIGRDGTAGEDPLQQMRDELDSLQAQWASEINFVELWQPYCQYANCSPILDFGAEKFGGTGLQLFESAIVPRKLGTSCNEEFILHVGGSVWALDWCPQRAGWKIWQQGGEFLAVGAHPISNSRQVDFGEPLSGYHKLGEVVSGKALVQIWAFNFPTDSDDVSNEGSLPESDDIEEGQSLVVSGSHEENLREVEMMDASENVSGRGGRGRGKGRGRGRGRRGRGGRGYRTPEKRLKSKARAKRGAAAGMRKEVVLPKMIMSLAHDGGVTWDMKWQPVGESICFQERDILRLGFLAMVLGDGSLQVFDLPLPKVISSIRSIGQSDPVVVSMEPVFKCSDLRSGGQKSIPLTIEWSSREPYDLLLAGCHDGTVAVWKFIPSKSGEGCVETRPLLFFTADSFAIRTVAWAPCASGIEGEHIVATAGHSGHLRFWDLRDPFRPLWELRLSRGHVLCMEWLEMPRCILVALDDGTLRTVSLNNGMSDTPVTGRPFSGTQAQGVQSYYCSSVALWGIQVCRSSGLVAYCCADGSVIHFELSEKAIEKGGTRYREPHYLSGAFAVNQEKRALVIVSADYPGPVQMKKSLTEWSFTPRSKRGFTVSVNQEMRASSIAAGLLPPSAETPAKKRKAKKGKKKADDYHNDMPLLAIEDNDDFQDPVAAASSIGFDESSSSAMVCKDELMDGGCAVAAAAAAAAVKAGHPIEDMPAKLVAVHRVRWNCNKGSCNWLCYGGAAGIVRCKQVILHST